jgi:hypothetical protein
MVTPPVPGMPPVLDAPPVLGLAPVAVRPPVLGLPPVTTRPPVLGVPPSTVRPPELAIPPAPAEPLVPALGADWPPLFPAVGILAGELDELHPVDAVIAQMTVNTKGTALAESKRSFSTECERDIAAIFFIEASGVMIPVCPARVQ